MTSFGGQRTPRFQKETSAEEAMALGSLSRGTTSSVKKTASAAEAPIWKNYLAIRTKQQDAASSASANKSALSVLDHPVRGRKRPKPSSSSSNNSSVGGGRPNLWMALSTTRRSVDEPAADAAAVLQRIRQFWEHLSVNERQQVLFMDEPELVKQLYKLNLSLLCVGLMQRHLKSPARAATAAANDKGASTEEKSTPVVPAAATAATAAAPAKAPATIDASAEKTYELLEAMEFMDIGTGILTVKSELVEDTERLFSLVGDVLDGFLTSVHVLTEKNFSKLFVTESETINTWTNYQRLIAMLVEQLILRSYVGHLEKEATQQMEKLLLEVSLEDKPGARGAPKDSSTAHKKRHKKKKKKKRRSTVRAKSVEQPPEAVSTGGPHHENEENTANSRNQLNSNVDVVQSTVEVSMLKRASEPLPSPRSPKLPFVEEVEGDEPVAEPAAEPMEDIEDAYPGKTKVDNLKSSSSGLNPNATVFQPNDPTAGGAEPRAPMAGKRKLDQYIINVPWQDVAAEEDNAFECSSTDDELSDRGSNEHSESESDLGHRRWRKHRRRGEDAELEWQLQQVYLSTAALFGWDFTKQCQLVAPDEELPWSESTLWRTAPREVVRYFSPGGATDSYSAFHGSQFLSGPAAFSGPPPSRYFFAPGPPGIPLPHSLMPPPGAESLPPHLHGRFSFQQQGFPAVVSSPDFGHTQEHAAYATQTQWTQREQEQQGESMLHEQQD